MRLLASARSIVEHRRWHSLSGSAVKAATAFLERSRATDDAVARMRAVQRRPETTLAEDEEAERAAGDAFEQCYLAALDLDTVSPDPDPERSAAELVRVMARLHSPAEPSWTPYRPGDGSRGHYMDGRGRTIAVETEGGEVVPGPWFKDGMTLPLPPL